MRRLKILMAGLLALGALLPARVVRAEGESKLIGTVVKIEVAEDGKSAVATLKAKGQMTPITITDELTLNKFKIKKIKKGDEIRCLYKVDGDKNLSVSFKRTAGC
jgi:hypothetical protein